MHKVGKRILLGAVGLLALYGITVCVLHFIFDISVWPFSAPEEEPEVSHYERLYVDEYPTQFIFWKKAVDLQNNLDVKTVDSVEELKKLSADTKYENTMLMIIDLEDELEIDDETLQQLCKVVDEGANLVYFGSKYLNSFLKYYDLGRARSATERSLIMFHEGASTTVLTRISGSGLWTTSADAAYQKDKNYLRERILSVLEESVVLWNQKIKDYEESQNQ